MALIRDFALQGAQMLLVLLLSPLLTGFVRKVKARLLRRQGPPLLQPYRDLIRLMRKDVVLATSASWLFRVIPYIIFAGTWVAASLVPTFRSGLLFSWSADLIAIIALLVIDAKMEWPSWLQNILQGWSVPFTGIMLWLTVALTAASGLIYLWRNREIYLSDV